VAAAATQPLPASGDVNASAPKALFHLLDKTLLLKHLRELKAEKQLMESLFTSLIVSGGPKSNPEEQDYTLLGF
jgi:hypothetical protein